jgi:uncharacterized protein (TIGR00369 family)
MSTIGARIETVEPGRVVIVLPWQPELGQQHGVLHAGVTASIADSACGYAALSLMPRGSAVMSVEFTVHLLAPGRGEDFRAIGIVRRAGRTLSVCDGSVMARTGSDEREIAMMTATMIRIDGRPEVAD